MSSDGKTDETATAQPVSALDIGFSSLGSQDGRSIPRTVSQASSRRSRKSEQKRQTREHSATPVDATSRLDEEASQSARDRTRPRRSGGFLLDTVMANGSPRDLLDPRGKKKSRELDTMIRLDSRRAGDGMGSADVSVQSSPLSGQLPLDGSTATTESQSGRTRPQSIDPSQLVQMALKLSESRRRYASNPLQGSSQIATRVSSAPLARLEAATASPVSTHATYHNGNNVPQDLPRGSLPLHERSKRGSQEIDGICNSEMNHTFYSFPPATLARAEKARKYFELASEHRRLLQYLPEMRSLAEEHIQSNWGRAYNPIQALRNRRTRLREKRPLTASPQAWQDVEKVRQWVDSIQSARSGRQSAVGDNHHSLPHYQYDEETSQDMLRDHAQGHRRSGTIASVITRPESAWTIEPAELLADAYWTEEGNNKEYLENRKGQPIFPSRHEMSLNTPKISVELHRDKNDVIPVHESDNENDEEADSHRQHRRTMLPLARGRAHRRFTSRSSSSSSISSRRGHSPGTNTRTQELDASIAPLARHMDTLIAKDERGELSSPDTMSSRDHWDSQKTRRRLSHTSMDRAPQDVIGQTDLRTSLDIPHEHRRSRSAHGQLGALDRAMSSAEDLDSEPTTPTVPGIIPPIGIDLSPPYNKQQGNAERKGWTKKLPSFQSYNKERNKIAQTDFANEPVNDLYTIHSNASGGPRSSQESSRAGITTVLNRHRLHEGSGNTLSRHETSSTFSSIREPGTTVGRLFKGGKDKLGGLVIERFRTRDRSDTGNVYDRGASDASDADEVMRASSQRPGHLTDTSSADVSPRASLERDKKPKYYLSNLPSFTSSSKNKRPLAETPASTLSDPFVRQQQVRPGKSDRFDRLAPPRIQLPGDAIVPDVEENMSTRGKSYGDLGNVRWQMLNSNSIPGSTHPGSNRFRGRHWSIYDKAPREQEEHVTQHDIARARALLLASGIKAREIQRRADHPREGDRPILAQAASAARRDPPPNVALKNEPLTAARLLSDHINDALSSFEQMLRDFESTTAVRLHTQFEDLQHKVSENLTSVVHNTSDEADAFTIELTTLGPQHAKQIDDAIDKMWRQRRRHLRLLRNLGFKFLEWLLLSLMWWIWFVVVVFKAGRRTVVGVTRLVRWLLVI